MKIKVDVRGTKQAVDDLNKLSRKALPHAHRDSINHVAFAARTMWIERVQKTFTLRNTYTKRSIVVDKARGTNIRLMRAVLGSRADYMGDREDGQTKRKRGKHGVAVPTAAAAGQTGRSRTRLIRAAFALKAIRLGRGARGTDRQRNAVAIRQAITSGRRVAFLRIGNRRSLVRVLGSLKRRKHKFRTLYDLSRARIRIKPAPTLKPVVKEARKIAPFVYLRMIHEQIARNRLFLASK